MGLMTTSRKLIFGFSHNSLVRVNLAWWHHQEYRGRRIHKTFQFLKYQMVKGMGVAGLSSNIQKTLNLFPNGDGVSLRLGEEGWNSTPESWERRWGRFEKMKMDACTKPLFSSFYKFFHNPSITPLIFYNPPIILRVWREIWENGDGCLHQTTPFLFLQFFYNPSIIPLIDASCTKPLSSHLFLFLKILL